VRRRRRRARGAFGRRCLRGVPVPEAAPVPAAPGEHLPAGGQGQVVLPVGVRRQLHHLPGAQAVDQDRSLERHGVSQRGAVRQKPPGDGTHQGGALVVLGVDGAAAGQDEEALLRTHHLRHAEARQAFAVDRPVDVGVELPAQQAPGDHLLKGPLDEEREESHGDMALQWLYRSIRFMC